MNESAMSDAQRVAIEKENFEVWKRCMKECDGIESPGQILDSPNELELIPTIQDSVFIHLRIILVDIYRNAM